MNLSDLISIVELLTTIVFGLYLTHWFNVKDTKTRAIKDYYINQLNKLKGDCDNFFDRLFQQNINAKEIISWYDVEQIKLENFDNGILESLPVRFEKLEKVVDDIYSYITNSEDYNNNFNSEYITLSVQMKIALKREKRTLDNAFNRHLMIVNSVPSFGIFHRHFLHLKYDYIFYHKEKKHNILITCLCITCHYFTTNFAAVFLLVMIVICTKFICRFYKEAGLASELQTKEIYENQKVFNDSLLIEFRRENENLNNILRILGKYDKE